MMASSGHVGNGPNEVTNTQHIVVGIHAGHSVMQPLAWSSQQMHLDQWYWHI